MGLKAQKYKESFVVSGCSEGNCIMKEAFDKKILREGLIIKSVSNVDIKEGVNIKDLLNTKVMLKFFLGDNSNISVYSARCTD